MGSIPVEETISADFTRRVIKKRQKNPRQPMDWPVRIRHSEDMRGC